MSNLTLPRLTFVTLNGMLSNARQKGSHRVKLAYETYVTYGNEGEVVIEHHGSEIARLTSDTIRLTNAGWHSRTTSMRMNRVLTDNSATPAVDFDGCTRYYVAIRDGLTVVLMRVWREGKCRDTIVHTFAGRYPTPLTFLKGETGHYGPVRGL